MKISKTHFRVSTAQETRIEPKTQFTQDAEADLHANPLILLAVLCEHSNWRQHVPFFAYAVCEHLCVLCERDLRLDVFWAEQRKKTHGAWGTTPAERRWWCHSGAAPWRNAGPCSSGGVSGVPTSAWSVAATRYAFPSAHPDLETRSEMLLVKKHEADFRVSDRVFCVSSVTGTQKSVRPVLNKMHFFPQGTAPLRGVLDIALIWLVSLCNEFEFSKTFFSQLWAQKLMLGAGGC